jgi:hypothetical protein
MVSVTPRPRFAPGKGSPVPIVQETGWAPEPVWTQRLEEISFASSGYRTSIARLSSPSQKLYCLSYPAPVKVSNELKYMKGYGLLTSPLSYSRIEDVVYAFACKSQRVVIKVLGRSKMPGESSRSERHVGSGISSEK